MTVIVTAGASARAVTSAAEVDLLGVNVSGTTTYSANGVALAGASRWSLVVSTTQDVTVRVYKKAGVNVGLTLLSTLTTVVTSAAPLTLEFADEANATMRVTAQASATTAAVNCDCRAVSP